MYTNVFGNAVFIKAEETPSPFSPVDPLPLFRRVFSIDQDVERAVITVQSPGFATYYLNGEPITKDIFISPVSHYDKLLWYDVYDVTPLLRRGENVLSVIAGNGFFNEPFDSAWHYQNSPWRDAPQFMLHLQVNGETVLESDATWKCSRERSPIIFSHLRSGEYYDARKADGAWLTLDYDDSDWKPVCCRPIPSGAVLKETPCQPVREVERISPVSMTKTDHGYLLDFGVTISGYMEITLTEPRDTEIVFRYAEEMDEEMRPRYNGMDDDCFYPESPFHINKMIASGGLDTFKPMFCYHGFRYVWIEGLTNAPDVNGISALFVHQDVERRSDFTCGSPLLNYIYTAGIRSTYSNLFWCLTDCPTREKLGWANDAAASIEQALINFDIKPLLQKWFEDIKVDVRPDGELPGIIPSNGWGENWGPVCDQLLYELPYRVYVYTGDASMLLDAIPYFERYIQFLTRKRKEENQFILGDWLGHGSSKLTPKAFVWDFFLVKALRITALAYRLKGDESKALAWEREKAAVAGKFMDTYLREDGSSHVTSQAGLSMMLQAELYRNREKITAQLIETVEKDGFQLTCGMVGVQYIYEALYALGRADYAYRLLAESDPGYKTWFEAGATTLWERWDGYYKGSHNHHMYSNVLSWFFKALLGIAPSEKAPAFAQIELKPSFIAEIGFARGWMDTVKGRIEAEWQYENGEFLYKVNIPAGIEATFRGELLSSGEHQFRIGEEK